MRKKILNGAERQGVKKTLVEKGRKNLKVSSLNGWKIDIFSLNSCSKLAKSGGWGGGTWASICNLNIYLNTWNHCFKGRAHSNHVEITALTFYFYYVFRLVQDRDPNTKAFPYILIIIICWFLLCCSFYFVVLGIDPEITHGRLSNVPILSASQMLQFYFPALANKENYKISLFGLSR